MADQEGGVLELAADVVDGLTWGYRFAHELATSGSEPLSGLSLSLATWAVGSVITAWIVLTVFIAWEVMTRAAQGWGRQLLRRATRGADLRTTQVLVAQYVRLTARTRVVPLAPGGPDLIDVLGGAEGLMAAADAFTSRRRGSVLAAIAFGVPVIVRSGLLLMRQLVTTVPGLFSLGATWWAAGQTGRGAVTGQIQGTNWGHLDTGDVAVIGVVLAALTFLLSRLRTARAVGHQAWRRSEAQDACEDLAEREIEIRKALAELDLASVQRRWASSLRELRQRLDKNLAQREQELRTLLGLPLDQERWPYKRTVRSGRASRAEVAARVAADAVENLNTHLDEIPTRTETRIRRSTPRRIRALASGRQLQAAIDQTTRYLQVPDDHVVQLEPAQFQTRIIAVAEGLDPETPAWGQVPMDRRCEVLEDVLCRWRQEADSAYQECEEWAHDRMIDGLIGIAELRAAKNAIFAYLHPAGPLTRILERLRPV